MESSLSVNKDYKKWLIFNDSLKNPDHLYQLYKSLSEQGTVGIFSVSRNTLEGQDDFQVVQEGYPEILGLSLDSKVEFQDYIKTNYFPDKSIEQWYQEKQQQVVNSTNQAVFERSYQEENYDWDNVKPYAKEVFYKNFKIGIACLAYSALIAYVILDGTDLSMYIGIGVAGSVLLLGLLGLLREAVISGYIKGNFVKLSPVQYKEVYDIVRKQAEALKIKVPEIYLTIGPFNASTARLIRTKYLVLNSEVLETFIGNNDDVLRYVIGHELAHIKGKHLSGEWWLYPSWLVPFLPQAHARAKEYTCDRIGYHFSKNGAIAGLMVLAVGRELAGNIKVDQFLKDSVEDRNFWYSFSEALSFHPHVSNRIEQIRKYDSLRS